MTTDPRDAARVELILAELLPAGRRPTRPSQPPDDQTLRSVDRAAAKSVT